jgi:hypothetical protein
MNEQEQAIAKIQQTLDYCIQQTLRSLEDTIERKAEVLPVNDLAEVERSEYTHALDELAAIYSKFPAVRSIKNYLHLPNYLWESTFFESLTMEEKRKWFHNHSLATYKDFCKDNTIYDESFPYFSIVYQVVVYEKYVQLLKRRIEQRILDSFIVMEKNEYTVSHKSESITEPATEKIQVETCTFEHSLNDQQIESLVDCVNEVRMFKGGEVSFEQLKSIFDCQPIIPLRSSNNRLLAFFFDQLSNHSYITEKWQSAIYKNNLFLSSQKDSFVNQTDISTAVNHCRDILMKGKFAKINQYINNLKGLSE